MKNPPIKLSRTLIGFKTLMLRIHVKLKEENGDFKFNYHNEFEFGGKGYVKINPSVYLSLEVINKDDVYDKSRSLLINQNNMYKIIMFLRRLIKNIYNKEVFVMRNGELVLYDEMVKKYQERLQISDTGAIIGQPAIIYDNNESSYEGVHLFINKTVNVAELTFSELESLLYTFEKIDLFQYSQAMLNYYLIRYKDIENQPNSIRYSNNRIQWDSKPKQTVTANFRKDDGNDIMSGIIKS